MATGIGETLRAARRQQEIPLSDAAASTRVRETYLAALEEEDFTALGGDVYVKGFIRSYARYLNVDPEPLLAAYRREYERADEVAPLSRGNRAVSLEPTRVRGVVVLAVGAGLVLLVLAGVRLFGGDDDAGGAEPAAPSPAATEPASGDLGQAAAPLAEGEGSQVAVADVVTVRITSREGAVGLVVVADSETVFDGVLEEGQTEAFEGQRVEVRLDDAAAVRLEVDGRDQGILGEPGESYEETFEVEQGQR